jgi:hypothetical protein
MNPESQQILASLVTLLCVLIGGGFLFLRIKF